MSTRPHYKLLLLEDHPDQYILLRDFLELVNPEEYQLDWISDFENGLEALLRQEHDVYLLDYWLGNHNSLQILERAREQGCTRPMIILTGGGSSDVDMAVMRAGATDYLEKMDLRPSALERSIRFAIERWQAVEALRHSEQRYRAVVEDQTELICRFLPDGTLTFVNGACSRYFGRKAEDLIGLSFTSLVLPEDQIITQQNLLSLSVEKPSATYEHRVMVDGAIRWQQWTIRLLLDGQDNVLEYQAVGRDVTERKQTEELLANERVLLRTVIDNFPGHIYVKDRQGRFLLRNNTDLGALNVSSIDELIGKSDFDLLPREVAEVTFAEEQKLIHSGQPIIQREFQRLNGQGWLEVSKYPLRDASGEIIGLVGVNQDITERKRAEKALRASEERLAAILANAPVFIVMLGRDERISYAGGRAREGGDIDTTTFVGKSLQDLFGDQIPPPITEHLAHARAGKSGSFDIDLAPYSFRARYAPMRNADGTIEGIIVVTMDMTEQRRIERELRETEERFRILFERAPDPYYLSDLNGVFIDGNVAAEKLLGYEKSELIGKSFLELEILDPEAVSRAVDLLRANIDGEPTGPDEFNLRRKDGHRVTVDITTVPILLGEQTVVLGMARDITRRKRAEQSEHEQRQLAEALVDTARAINSTLDLDEILERILVNVGHVVPHDYASIMLIDSGLTHVRHYQSTHPAMTPEAVKAITFPVMEIGNFREMIESRRPYVISDIREYPSWIFTPGFEWPRSYAGIPIIEGSDILGFVDLVSMTPGFYSPSLLPILEAFMEQITTAVTNARLYNHARELASLEERQRLARDLHDAVSQTLFSARLIAESLPRLAGGLSNDVQGGLAELATLNRRAHLEMRSLLLELRPFALTETPMHDLLRQLADTVSSRASIPVTVSAEPERPLPGDVKVMLYRIAQEALNNAVKHSQAARISVEFRSGADLVTLRIRDDGRGYEPAEAIQPGRFGLGIMRERAQAVGAHIDLLSAPGRGSEVIVAWSGGGSSAL